VQDLKIINLFTPLLLPIQFQLNINTNTMLLNSLIISTGYMLSRAFTCFSNCLNFYLNMYWIILICLLQSYVNCALGIHVIGFVWISYGSVNAVTSFVISHVARHVKRVYLVTSGATFNAGLLLVLTWWSPTRDDQAMFYVVASCLGLVDAIWQTQTNSQ